MTLRALLRSAEDDPDIGFLKRRALRIKALGIRAIGPTLLRPEPPVPTKVDRIRSHRHENQIERDLRLTIDAEIAALDAHAAIVTQHIEALESTSGASSFALQEMKAERRQLAELRVMLQDDLASGPILRDRDGREISDRDRAITRARAAEMRESLWAQANRCDSSGERREARRLRRDALRSRQIAEYEAGWRTSLPGYGMSAWT